MDEAQPESQPRWRYLFFLNIEVAGNGRGEAEERTAQPDAIARKCPAFDGAMKQKVLGFLAADAAKEKPKPFCELRRPVKLVAGNGIEPLTFRL